MNDIQRYVFEYEQLVGRRFTIKEAKKVFFEQIKFKNLKAKDYIKSWKIIENKFLENLDKFS